MTERERLLNLLKQNNACAYMDCELCMMTKKNLQCIPKDITDYLLNNGVIVPPCKIGDKLYEIDLPEYGIIVCEAKRFVLADKNSVIVNVIDGHGKDSEYYFEFEDFGKTVFLSREDAIKALEEMEKE